MKTRSLKIRLLALQAVAIILALGITGYSLTYLFERSVERRIDTELDTYLTQIAARLSFDQSGKPQLGSKLADPRFDNIYSGLYWQIVNTTVDQTIRSRSLWDTELILPAEAHGPNAVHSHYIGGPQKSSLLVHERSLIFRSPIGEQTVRMAVALDLAELEILSSVFAAEVALSLLLLGTFLLAAAWVQVTMGLSPLSLVQKSVASIRNGTASRISADLPSEVLPLAKEVNDLLAAQEIIMQREKHRADNLAHGFKTPLTALISDIRRLRDKGEDEIAGEIETATQIMRRHIDKELTSARLREAGNIPSVQIVPILDGIVATLRRTPDGEIKTIQTECSHNLYVQIEKDDLTEILGNLIENAVKHAKSRVVVKAFIINNLVTFEIEDDGPGISDVLRETVQKRGARLDQSIAGSGLGLAIVNDVLEIYQQTLDFEKSSLGGLKVCFQLPFPEPKSSKGL